MRTRTKVWIIIATSLVLLGCILFAGVMTMLKWDFVELSTVKYETNTYEIGESFDSISMNTDTADIVFDVSDNGKCIVECHEEENNNHIINVKENTLVIEATPKEYWNDYISLSFGLPKIKIYLPKTEYYSLLISEETGDIEIPADFTFKNVDISLSTGDVDFYAFTSETVKIKTSTGDICVENVSVGKLDLFVSTGKVNITDIMCKNFTSSGNTGNISLDNVIAIEKLCVERSTGYVKFNKCDASEIYVKTDTGDVSGNLISDKVFITKTDTGSVIVPNSVAGGKCEITTNTGNIKLDVIS